MAGTNTIQQYASTWQARLDRTTDLTIRKRHLLSFMSNRGRITGPSGGRFVEWPLFVQAKKPRGFGRNTPPNYETADNLRMPQLNWSSYFYGEQIHVLDIEENKGKEQFIDLVSNAYDSVEKSFSQEWADYLFQDGSTATEENPMYGLKSAFKYYTATTATSGAPRQGYEGKVRLPNGTYAGYDTTLGANGGNWAGDNGLTTYNPTGTTYFHWWPEGNGDGKFDFWSPLIVNTTSQGWGSTSAAFDTTYCEKQIDFGYEYSARNNTTAAKGPVELILMPTKSLLVWRERFATTQRTIVETAPVPMEGSINTSGGDMTRITGTPCILHNGCTIATDYSLNDSNLIIGINPDAIEYRTVHSMNPQTGGTRIMTPHREAIPGGSGIMIGGMSHGQFIINSPRKLTFWYPLGNYT